MCSSLLSAILECLASVKCDSTFLKLIWGLIEVLVYIINVLFPFKPSLLWLRSKKKPHDPDSVLQVTRGWILQTWLQEGWSCSSKAGFSCQLRLWSLTALERETALFLQYRRTSLGCHDGTGTLWRNCATVVLQINEKVALLGRPSKWQMHWCIIRTVLG